MKALVGTFDQEKALVGAFSVIVQPVVEPMDQFAALVVMAQVRMVINTLHLVQRQHTGTEAETRPDDAVPVEEETQR